MSTVELALPAESDTLALGLAIARNLEAGSVVYLEGDLGAGKTTFVRGLLRALGFAGHVKSPTYAWVEPYELSKLSLYHFDFYRFESGMPWRDTGFDEMFDGTSVCVVEWPDRAGPQLPAPDLRIHLETRGAGRVATLSATTQRGVRLMKGLH